MEEDFGDKNLVKKNLVKKGNAFEYNVHNDNSADQVPIEFVPMETSRRKGREETLGEKSKVTKAGSGEKSKVRSNEMMPSPRKRVVTKKKLKLGGGFASKGFRGSTSTRSYQHSVSVLQLAF